MRPKNTLTFITVIVAGFCLAAGCGAVSGAKEAVVGPPDDAGLRRTIIIDPGYQPLDRILTLTEETVEDSAHSGHRIQVLLIDGGNASSARQVDLAEANGGDLRRQARNGPGRSEEAERNAQAVIQAIQAQLVDFSYTGSGADLFGAIGRATSGLPGADQVVLITGGGVHRTVELDVVRDYQQKSELLAAIPAIAAPDTDLIVLGAADFTGSTPAPTREFTDTVASLWQQACNTWDVKSCTLASDAGVFDALKR